MAGWGQVSWCPRGAPPGGRPHRTERRGRGERPAAILVTEITVLQNGGGGVLHTRPWGAEMREKCPASSRPQSGASAEARHGERAGEGWLTAEMTQRALAVRGRAGAPRTRTHVPRLLPGSCSRPGPPGDRRETVWHPPDAALLSSAELAAGGPVTPGQRRPVVVKSLLTVWRSLPGCKASGQPASCGAC